MVMRRHTNGGYQNVVDECWRQCEAWNAKLVIMYQNVACKNMATVQGLLDEQGRQRGYDLICEMDCDFSHDPKALPSLLKAAETNDLVIGSRYCGGIRVMNWPMSRLLLSTGAGVYVRMITGMPIMDPTGGFKCFHRQVLESIDLDKIRSNGYSFQIEMNHTAWTNGFRIVEVPIIFEDRRAGYSKMKLNIATEAIWMVLKLWFRNGLRRWPKVRNRK